MRRRLKSASRVAVAIAVTPVVVGYGFLHAQIKVDAPRHSSSCLTPFGHTATYRRHQTWRLPRPQVLLGRPKKCVATCGYCRPCGCMMMSPESTGLPLSGSAFGDGIGSIDEDRATSTHRGQQDVRHHGSLKPNGWDAIPDGEGSSKDEKDDEERNAPSAGAAGEIGTGSQEFVNLVRAQFDVLAATLDVSQIVLFVRRENTETGALEFIPAMVYPEKARVWVMDADGIQVHEGPKELPWTESAADVLPNYPFITVRKRGDDWETPDAVENEDGGLSAPLMYASLVLGMITVWKDRNGSGTQGEEGGGEAAVDADKASVWDDRDKDTLEKISSSVAMAAVLDERQRWAAAVQVEHLRRVLSESLHQVKNPMTALRTFGKLLLRRLPRDDTLNRELAKDIILQSDRLVDLLLPVDSVIGLLAQAVDNADPSSNSGIGTASIGDTNAAGGHHPQLEGVPGAAAYNGGDELDVDDASPAGRADNFPGNVPQGVQDALLSPHPREESVAAHPLLAGTAAGGGQLHLDLLFVQDVIEPVTRAAQAVAQARRVCFRWRVDDDLPGVVGDERALEEALSNVVENALKYCNMGPGRHEGGDRATVVLRARPSNEEECLKGANSGVVIEVVDNGPGVDLDDLPFIFDRGYRGRQPREHGIPGTGLGLGIARDIMRSMGGGLEVRNKEEDGWGAGVKLFLPRRVREGEWDN